MRHGYQYRRLEGRPGPWSIGRNPTWSKLSPLTQTVSSPDCDYTVFYDSDAMPVDQRWSLDDMRFRWGMQCVVIVRRCFTSVTRALTALKRGADSRSDAVSLYIGKDIPGEVSECVLSPVVALTDRRNVVNTGFMVVKNDATAYKALMDTMRCPDEIPACEIYRRWRQHEQSAFNYFVRPQCVV